MSSPLIERLTDELGYPRLSEANFESFIKDAPYSVLFFTENATRFPESNDVAVILPELVKRFPMLSPAVIDTQHEKSLQGRYNFTVWPTLVFLKEGRYLGAIPKVQNWDDYVREITILLTLEPRRDPGIGIPVVAVGSEPSGCAG
jgi:hydrogenase-1 operon protein HyaE